MKHEYVLLNSAFYNVSLGGCRLYRGYNLSVLLPRAAKEGTLCP